jgi:hypothetical protein
MVDTQHAHFYQEVDHAHRALVSDPDSIDLNQMAGILQTGFYTLAGIQIFRSVFNSEPKRTP